MKTHEEQDGGTHCSSRSVESYLAIFLGHGFRVKRHLVLWKRRVVLVEPTICIYVYISIDKSHNIRKHDVMIHHSDCKLRLRRRMTATSIACVTFVVVATARMIGASQSKMRTAKNINFFLQPVTCFSHRHCQHLHPDRENTSLQFSGSFCFSRQVRAAG